MLNTSPGLAGSAFDGGATLTPPACDGAAMNEVTARCPPMTTVSCQRCPVGGEVDRTEGDRTAVQHRDEHCSIEWDGRAGVDLDLLVRQPSRASSGRRDRPQPRRPSGHVDARELDTEVVDRVAGHDRHQAVTGQFGKQAPGGGFPGGVRGDRRDFALGAVGSRGPDIGDAAVRQEHRTGHDVRFVGQLNRLRA